MRKLIFRTEKFILDDEWQGWEFEAVSNPPLSVIYDLSSGDIENRVIPALVSQIKRWNFVDEEGNDLGPPSLEAMNRLPVDLVMLIANGLSERAGKTEKN